ncbi:MAG: hypothetical protein HFK09_01010 [Clostridia bacterium]|nr:hypothetical protein [Clostridia bacterium]
MAQSNSIVTQTKLKAKDTVSVINGFVDEGSFVETDTLLSSITPLGEAIGEGVVSGFACINGIQAAVFATNPAVLKGSIGIGAANKITRLVENAVKTGVPVISVIDTSGARFGEGVEVLEGYGKILNALASAYGSVPTVCVLKGANYGMLSYMTAFSDLIVAFDKAVMATSSPLIIASKTKDNAANVGTAAVHASSSGMVTNVVKSVSELRKTVGSFLELVGEKVAEPSDELNRVCKTLKAGAKASNIVKEVTDKGTLLELRAEYAPEVITCLARLGGISVGIVANNSSIDEGKLTPKASIKIGELLNLCEVYGLPVINLVDCGGVVTNPRAENCCLIREIGSLIYNYSQIRVGKISLVVGSAIGAGYTILCARSVFDYTAAWESAEVGALSSEAAARLLYADEIAGAKDKEKAEQKLADAYAKENMGAGKVGAIGLFDNVIKPEFTRNFLISAVQTFLSKR